MIMRLRVGKLLAEREMTAYALAKASDGVISLPTAYRLAGGEFKAISARVIDALCDIFGVEPGELFERGQPKKARR